MTIKLVQMSLQKLDIEYKNNLLLLMIFGTGVSYYAFDRFSMSHIYEFFGTSFLIYLSAYSFDELADFKSCLPLLFNSSGPVMGVVRVVPGEKYPADYEFIHSRAARSKFRKALKES